MAANKYKKNNYLSFIIASISTAIPMGNVFEPTANLVCRPCSPKILTSKSDAPLMISG